MMTAGAIGVFFNISALALAPVIKESIVEGVYEIEGSFQVNASSHIAWQVLTDYEHISEFVSSMRRSAVLERHPDVLLVEQEARTKAFFFSKEVHVVLDVREEPHSRIYFKDVSSKDFEIYEGSWILEETPAVLQATYKLKAKPRTKIPRFIGRHVLRENAANLLDAVRTEIVRRGNSAQ